MAVGTQIHQLRSSLTKIHTHIHTYIYILLYVCSMYKWSSCLKHFMKHAKWLSLKRFWASSKSIIFFIKPPAKPTPPPPPSPLSSKYLCKTVWGHKVFKNPDYFKISRSFGQISVFIKEITVYVANFNSIKTSQQ